MNKKRLKQAAMTEERLKDIQELIKNKEYDKIYKIYGQKIYGIAVPDNYKKKDIKKLLKEGLFGEIYRKYGEQQYKKYIRKIEQLEVLQETGSRPKSIFNRMKNTVQYTVAPSLLAGAISIPLVPMSIDVKKELNGIYYAKEIEKYNNKINDYAEKINSMHLTDTQIFMKIMEDIWEEIDGYGFPKKEILGYLRLTLENEGIGVCRNFADDMTAKLNAINSEYNARNIAVYFEDDNQYKFAKIQRKFIDGNETIKKDESDEKDIQNEDNKTSLKEEENRDDTSEIYDSIISEISKITGNHMVTAADIPDKNITVILDPTNPSIGVLKDGEIYMFSTSDGSGLEIKKMGQFMMEGIDNTIDLYLSESKSLIPSEYTLEELEELYGTQAQNDALEYLASLENKESKNKFVSKVEINEKKANENIKKYIIEKNNKEHDERDLK